MTARRQCTTGSRPRRITAAVLLVVAGIAASCGTPDTLVRGAAIEPAPSQRSSDALPVPFASVIELGDIDAAALHDAVGNATALCMADAGFAYEPPPYTPAETPPSLFGNLAYARASGYGIVASLDPPDHPTLDSHGPTWRQALIGTASFDQLSSAAAIVPGTGGMRVAIDPASCASRARTTVYGDDLAWQQAKARITYLQHLAYAAAIGDGAADDPGWIDAVAAWQACMTERGYDLPAPLAAIPDLEERAHSDGIDLQALRAEELATAAADANCVHSTGLGDLAHQRLADAESRIAAEHPEGLTAYQNVIARALDRARADDD